MTNTKKSTKVIATVMAVIIAIASLSVIASVSASAKSVEGTAQAHAAQKIQSLPSTTKLNTAAKTYIFTCKGKTTYGYNYDYNATTNNVKVKCDYNFKSHTYTFKFTGVAKSTTNLTLKYFTSNKTTVKVPMTFKVDAQKNIIRTK